MSEKQNVERWTCEVHGITTVGDCLRCDDELIALTEAEEPS